MKTLLAFVSLCAPVLIAQKLSEQLSVVQSRIIGCTEQFSIDVEDILTQFRGLATENQLKTYREFMIMRKQYEDLSFILQPYQQTLNAEERGRLRTPMQNYTDCRSPISEALGFTVQTLNPPQVLLQPCERNYATDVQQVLNYYRPSVTQPKLFEYEDFMIMLKQFEDIGFKMRNFEQKNPYDRVARLQFPVAKYNNCRDAVVRTYGVPYGNQGRPQRFSKT
jgi:hypothetical protein